MQSAGIRCRPRRERLDDDLRHNTDLHNSTTLVATLFPKTDNGQYVGTASKTVFVNILPVGGSAVNSVVVQTSQQASTSSSMVSPAIATPTIAAHAPFTAPMSKASKNPQVTALQKFLARIQISIRKVW